MTMHCVMPERRPYFNQVTSRRFSEVKTLNHHVTLKTEKTLIVVFKLIILVSGFIQNKTLGIEVFTLYKWTSYTSRVSINAAIWNKTHFRNMYLCRQATLSN